MFWLERDDDDLMVVDDAPGLHVNMFQSQTNHIMVSYDSLLHNNLMQLQLCYMYKLGCIRFVVFFGRVFSTVDDFML